MKNIRCQSNISAERRVPIYVSGIQHTEGRAIAKSTWPAAWLSLSRELAALSIFKRATTPFMVVD